MTMNELLVRLYNVEVCPSTKENKLGEIGSFFRPFL